MSVQLTARRAGAGVWAPWTAKRTSDVLAIAGATQRCFTSRAPPIGRSPACSTQHPRGLGSWYLGRAAHPSFHPRTTPSRGMVGLWPFPGVRGAKPLGRLGEEPERDPRREARAAWTMWETRRVFQASGASDSVHAAGPREIVELAGQYSTAGVAAARQHDCSPHARDGHPIDDADSSRPPRSHRRARGVANAARAAAREVRHGRVVTHRLGRPARPSASS